MVEDLSLKNITRRAQVKTNIEDGNLVYLPHGQAAKSGLNKSMLDAAHGQFTTVIKYVAGSWVKALYSLTPRELLKIAGIVSTKCLKNCQTDGILVSVANLWIETQI